MRIIPIISHHGSDKWQEYSLSLVYYADDRLLLSGSRTGESAMFRVALVGAGGIAKRHAACYAKIANAELVGVMDIHPEAAKTLAEKHGVQAFTDFDVMLAQLQPDVVDVCCPTPWHAEYVCRAAERAGALGIKGVSTEKPMARTLEDCQKMIVACEQANVPLFVAHVVRFFPEFALAKRGIEEGYVGAPAAIRTRRGGPMPRGWNNWYGDFPLSGGCVLDLLVHDFDWLRWTFGDMERVYAKGCGTAALPAYDYALVTLRFRSGAIGHVEGTWNDPDGFKVAFEIAGDAGLAEYNFNQPSAAPFKRALNSLPTAEQAASASSGSRVAVPESPTDTDPYQAELQHFLDALETGTPPSITPQDGMEAVRIALAALESIQTGLPVTL